ncbi:glycoside hydrolase family 95 protein [Filimonas effusa]|uniref:Glycoside hydrolase family 95 protein n=1 Tax=Filimonas effusa TaxID=2508721 RepID=A0A4V1M9W4_9BACT|nr:glycoside hydrolase family 95 protein [Filimonas effusa]RXK83084.1 glycoside hydrolase family 95 protein [Filimonas effusa]
MKYSFAIFNLLAAVFYCSGSQLQAQSASPSPLQLWYRQPAANWNEALPLGNGQLGAMDWGGAATACFQLNEHTLWTGGPAPLDPNKEAIKYLSQVRAALFRDSIKEAISLLRQMQGPNTQMYQPMGDLLIRQSFTGEPAQYQRQLNLSTASTLTSFQVNGVTYTRQAFISAPDNVMQIHIKANRPGALSFETVVQHPLPYYKMITTDNQIVLAGKARINSDADGNLYSDDSQCAGMRFQFRVKLAATDGQVTTTDSSLQVNNATEAILLVAGATSFNGYDKCPDKDGKNEAAITTEYIQKALTKTAQQRWNAHLKDYRSFFNRVSLDLGASANSALPTDKRLAAYKKGDADPALEALYFQYGRYLLISCSRPGGQPANLQGMWNKELSPPWRSNYTTNINLQMNYWPAEVCNLSEMTEPLIRHIQRLAKNGTATASEYYHAKGWVVHHNTDIWAQTNPVGEGAGDPKWANWSLGSPWLSQHLYEHYRFTGNKRYLRDTAYPLMKTAALFCLDWLVEKDGWLVTAPSTSPENEYILPGGTKGTVTVASTMDMEIIWDLFTNIMEASNVLGIDQDFAALVKQKRSQLRPFQIGRKGNLVEWYADWEDTDPKHRHVSHLFGLHPGREISPLLDSAIANACRRTLEIRGDGGTGWSKAWKINFWARLLDGNHAYKMLGELLRYSTLDNLFDTHPPFQIDGNFGATAGIAEMLLQSHLNEIQLLPALPNAWEKGNVKGLVARGGFEIELFWEKGKLTKAFILSRNGAPCKLATNNKITIKGISTTSKQQTVNSNIQYITTFTTKPGTRYEVTGLL